MGTISDEYMGRNDPYKKPVVSTEELDEKLRAIKLQRKEQLANGKVEFEYFLSSSEIAQIGKLIDPFDFVEPCEPDCTPERHAYHQGQWDMAVRINQAFGLEGHP